MNEKKKYTDAEIEKYVKDLSDQEVEQLVTEVGQIVKDLNFLFGLEFGKIRAELIKLGVEDFSKLNKDDLHTLVLMKKMGYDVSKT